jgi:glycosyltransferase involved in cell wall biosynthesis
MDAQVSIIIPAFNQVEYCRQCLHSLLAGTQGNYRLILVDNGSTDGAGELFDTVPGATVLHAGENLGFAGGINLGLRHAQGHALLLNSDTLLPEGWLGILLRALESDPAIGMVGPRSNNVSGSQQIDGLEFATLDEINDFAQRRELDYRGQLRDVARLVGFCLLIRDTVWQHVGVLDEAYGIGNFEDDDYCVRVLRAGHRLCVAEDAFVFHYGSRTFLGMGILDDEWRSLIATNQRHFEAKWNTRVEERSDQLQSARQRLREAASALAAGDGTEALRLALEAVRLAPTYEVARNDLGAVLWSLGQHERALAQFEQAVRMNPAYEPAVKNLQDATAALGRNRS